MDEKKFLSELTLEEKLDLCCGGDFWRTAALPQRGVPALVMSDGPHGLCCRSDSGTLSGIHDSVPATCFPTASLSACSWDRDLIAQTSMAVAKEAVCAGVDVILGPGINIKRNPLCGRNFEYYSEDPYLAGQMGTAFSRGAKEAGVGVCLKHFAANSQEYKRFSSDSIVDERAMREIYLAAFETVVKEGDPAFVMCAYNKLNGIYCSDNRKLLTDILRKEWGFSGAVVTDWGAMHDREAGFRAGCDLSMPGGSRHHQIHAKEAVLREKLDESFINESAERLLCQIGAAQKRNRPAAAVRLSDRDRGQTEHADQKLKKDGKQNKTADFGENAVRDILKDHHQLARRVAAESAVLLKNDGVLPLKTKKVCLVGAMAKDPRYQGAGSSHVNPARLSAMDKAASDWVFVPGCDEQGGTSETLLEKARSSAAEAEAAVVVAGLLDSCESEGYDREHMRLPDGHNRMVEVVADANPNTIVVLMCGSPVELSWYTKVRAILYLGLSGQAGCEAAVDLLTGKSVPCGKLAETWPLRYSDVVSGSYYGKPYKDAQYRESIYVGYRYYESAGLPVRFPFGFGLSYTSFAYQDLRIDGTRVSLTVKNTGNCAGSEIVQLYIAPMERVTRVCTANKFQEAIPEAQKPSSEKKPIVQSCPASGERLIHRPALELRGFEKVFLKPGEKKTIVFLLNKRCFAIWLDGWKVPRGEYEIRVGASSQDIRLRKTVIAGEDFFAVSDSKYSEFQKIPLVSAASVKGENNPVQSRDVWYVRLSGIPSQEEFEQLLGRKISKQNPPRRGSFDMENTIDEMAQGSLLLKIVRQVMRRAIAGMCGCKPDSENAKYRMNVSCALDCALFTAVNNGGKMLPECLAYALLDAANGRFMRAVGRIMVLPLKMLKKMSK